MQDDTYEVFTNDDIIIHLKIKNLNNQTSIKNTKVSEFNPMPRDLSRNANLELQTKKKDTSLPYSDFPFVQNTNKINKSSYHNIIQNTNTNNISNPSTTNSQKCLWCCHSFCNQIYHLPLFKYQNNFMTFGKFCSPECAASYNFNDVICFGNAYERYSLLHDLYFDIFKGNRINLAPSRLALKIFGGKLTISKFREISKNPKYNYSITIAPIKTLSTYYSLHSLTQDNTTYQNNSSILTLKRNKQTEKTIMNFLN